MLQAKQDYDALSLIASAARTAATGSGSAVRLPGMMNAVVFILDVTAAATDAGDLLDVYVQTKADWINWVDVVHFTQCSGTGSTKRYFAKLIANGALTEFENASALGAASARHIIGDDWRVRWAITDVGGDDASFTFSVWACPM